MKKLTHISLLLFCVAAFAFGQGLPMTVPEEVGVSAKRLKRIRSLLQGYYNSGQVSGFLTVVARRGKIVHFETIGMRDVENSKPIESDTIFHIYSMSKPITSVAVMMLYEEGHFQLGTPVSRFIPEFENMKVYNEDQTEILDAKKKITIKHLLMHTAGLTYGWGNKPVDTRYKEAKIREPGSTLADMVKKLGNIPLVHEPNEKWTYSVSTDVLGYLVEVVSGMPFEEFLQKRLFEPLGMVDTGFSVPPEKRDRLATLYRRTKENGIERTKRAAIPDDEFTFFPSGGGGLVSTAADYMRFSQMLLNGGELEGVRILGKKTVELMRYPHHNNRFGLGFAIVTDRNPPNILESVGNFSWGGAAATTFWIDPQEELVGLLMTQLLNNRYPFQQQFKVLTYQALTE
ncbi:beta-lactamase family protein [Candidatus Poribacteria bacterium]|nr:beta-lactamase family protein [Candidatus Poribacteria bacterium]MYH79807.1 beta-lactamase family protein [Candidatus Poribacteria bacterium]MYK94450.1 beta-lactamase family protein [Candidatus Poribacteria bacterium]